MFGLIPTQCRQCGWPLAQRVEIYLPAPTPMSGDAGLCPLCILCANGICVSTARCGPG